MATHSSIRAWEIPWTEEPGGLLSMGSQTVRHDLATKPTNNSVLGVVPNSVLKVEFLALWGPLPQGQKYFHNNTK